MAADSDQTTSSEQSRAKLLEFYLKFKPNPKKTDNMILIRQGAPGAPTLFFCPATDGTVTYFQHYLPYLPADWTMYGCQTPGVEGEQAPFRTIEQIAAYDVNRILEMQPEGPYFIGGFCNGGLVCYEICKQLQDRGKEVALCLDFLPLFPREWTALAHMEAPRKRVVQDFMFVFDEFLGNRMEGFPVEKVLTQDDAIQIDLFLDLLREHGYLQTEQEAQVFRHRVDVYNAGLEAMLSYKPEQFHGVVEVIAAGEEEMYHREIQEDSPYATHLCAVQTHQRNVHFVDVPGKTFVNGKQPFMDMIGELIREITTRADPR